MKWGDVEAANGLLQIMTKREGFGDVLAEGVKRASEQVGGDPAGFAIYTHKGTTPRSHDHRGRWAEMLEGAVTSIGTIETGPLVHIEDFGLPATHDPFDPRAVAHITASMLGRPHFVDSLGICKFTANAHTELVCGALNAVTGWDYTLEEVMTFGKRTAAMFRLFNLRNGIGPDLERPSERYWSTPVDGPAAGTSAKENWGTMIRTYYETAGLDRESGRPLPETLRKLGLEHLVSEVWGAEAAKVGG